jgi:translation initiation factor IF-2|tara:strand:- start:4512 stop:7007 length:2496 start_codon:yes stop_codon:yes gene_type:complete
MSVRIYELSKDLGMSNAELIALLRDRGYQIKSASSTVDNISAESLRGEYTSASEKPAEVPAAPEPVKKAAPVAPPAAALVRSKEDIQRERAAREKEAEEALVQKGPPPLAPPAPGGRKSPPPLPGGPTVTIRQPSPVAPLAVNVPSKAPSLPGRGPALRTDIKQPEPTPEAPAAKAPPTATPPRSGPAPVSPPRISAPPSVSRPPIPPAATPSSADEGEQIEPVEGAEEAEVEGTEDDTSDLKKLQVKTPIVVRDFAIQIGRKPFQLISELMELSIFASMNTAIEEPVAQQLARKAGFVLEIRHRGEGQQPKKEVEEDVDESALMEPRPPVVCILGHVDHGKTTLLDAIRKSNVVDGEAGGITQHVAAYQIQHKEQKISFIDTPGHAAFSNMRARGANMTDIAILVVAADDGFMKQTDEALSHIRKAGLPVVVAINKMDAPGANVEKVMRQMQERELTPEEWGGETLFAKTTAIKGEGISELLDIVLLQAEILETLKANPNAPAEGVVLEAQKEIGRGCTASVIVQKGTLKPGDALVCGEHYCRVRQLINDQGKAIKSAPPSTPVNIVGWSGPPAAGDIFSQRKNERIAKREGEDNELERKKLEAASRTEGVGVATIEDIFAAIAKTKKANYRVVIKADVYGTAEALATSLLAIESDKIDLEVIDTGVGPVTKNDVMRASAGTAAVVAFNVGIENGVNPIIKHQDVTVISGTIIYELIDAIKDVMADQLEPELREVKVGAAEVRAVFPFGRGFVAGCMVTEGKVQRNAKAVLMRGKDSVYKSTVQTLKRFKDDAKEVRAGYECGIAIADYQDYKEGDVIEVFETEKIKPSL